MYLDLAKIQTLEMISKCLGRIRNLKEYRPQPLGRVRTAGRALWAVLLSGVHIGGCHISGGLSAFSDSISYSANQEAGPDKWPAGVFQQNCMWYSDPQRVRVQAQVSSLQRRGGRGPGTRLLVLLLPPGGTQAAARAASGLQGKESKTQQKALVFRFFFLVIEPIFPTKS